MKLHQLLFCVFLFLFLSFSTAFGDELLLQPDGVSGKDAALVETNPSSTYGNDDDLTINYSSSTDHGLIEFDLSSLPADATIDSATLELREYSNCSINQNAIEIHLNSAFWDESTVTWTNAPAYGPSIATNSGETANCDWLIFDVTSAVNDWYNGASSNYGFRVTGPSETDVIKFIYSSDHSIASDRPILRINYTPQSQAIPTMTEWGMIVFTLLLGASAIWYMRRRTLA